MIGGILIIELLDSPSTLQQLFQCKTHLALSQYSGQTCVILLLRAQLVKMNKAPYGLFDKARHALFCSVFVISYK